MKEEEQSHGGLGIEPLAEGQDKGVASDGPDTKFRQHGDAKGADFAAAADPADSPKAGHATAADGPKAVAGPPIDEAVTSQLRKYLKNVTMDVTERQLRTRLEEHFGVPLKDKKALIRNEVVEWLSKKQEEDTKANGKHTNGNESEEDIKPTKKRKGGGLNKPCLLSERMQNFLGSETMSRPDVVKALWSYIKEKELQDPKDRRNILLDDKLKTMFTSPLTMFSINSQLSKHVYTHDAPLDAEGDPLPSKPKARAKPRSDKAEKPKKKKRRASEDPNKPKKPNALTKPVTVSEQLSAFLGGVKQISRQDLTKRFWEYAKEKGLMNPDNGREVICDQVLRDLTGQERFHGFSFAKYIKGHIHGPAEANAAATADDSDKE